MGINLDLSVEEIDDPVLWNASARVRAELHAAIQSLATSNEEQKAINEEALSVNEEYQSTNEELLTSKEELQSVNEELQTVNGELAHRVAELGRSNSDLKNLLEATQIATLFLDNDLRVRSFTPSATEIFHLLETDVGRPLGHVVSRVDYPELQDDVRRVLVVPEFQDRLKDEGGRSLAMTPEEFTAFIRTETVRWGKVVRDVGAKLD